MKTFLIGTTIVGSQIAAYHLVFGYFDFGSFAVGVVCMILLDFASYVRNFR